MYVKVSNVSEFACDKCWVPYRCGESKHENNWNRRYKTKLETKFQSLKLKWIMSVNNFLSNFEVKVKPFTMYLSNQLPVKYSSSRQWNVNYSKIL